VELFEFNGYPLPVNIAIFGLSAVVVWIAGTRVARYADKIATMTGIGHATIGLLLLAGITSLPEVAVSLTSAAAGTPALAVNNLLGGVALQVAILAVADAFLGKQALTVIAASPLILLQITMSVLLLLFLAAAIVVGDTPLFGAGAWSWGLLAMYAIAIWTISNSQGSQSWVVQRTRRQVEHARQREAASSAAGGGAKEQGGQGGGPADGEDQPLRPVLVKTSFAGAAILVAGFLLSRTGDAIAQQTGLGRNFVGAVFMAMATSLPEVSTVLSAVKLRRYEMAISDIFGTGLFNVTLVFLIDALYRGGPVLNEVGRFSLFASLMASALGGIYLVGLIERRDRTVARMGIDSFAVLLVYLGGLWLLYRMR
jgi:cation:H+ antiporter